MQTGLLLKQLVMVSKVNLSSSIKILSFYDTVKYLMVVIYNMICTHKLLEPIRAYNLLLLTAILWCLLVFISVFFTISVLY
jgi:hypothetical protein